MQVLVTGLTEHVSITLHQGADGWRFVSWSRSGSLEGELIMPPAHAEFAHRFASSDEALAYFRPLVPAWVDRRAETGVIRPESPLRRVSRTGGAAQSS